jgi:hypothetical protein
MRNVNLYLLSAALGACLAVGGCAGNSASRLNEQGGSSGTAGASGGAPNIQGGASGGGGVSGGKAGGGAETGGANGEAGAAGAGGEAGIGGAGGEAGIGGADGEAGAGGAGGGGASSCGSPIGNYTSCTGSCGCSPKVRAPEITAEQAINECGGTSAATVTGATVNAWGESAQLSADGTKLAWSDGSVWVRQCNAGH